MAESKSSFLFNCPVEDSLGTFKETIDSEISFHEAQMKVPIIDNYKVAVPASDAVALRSFVKPTLTPPNKNALWSLLMEDDS